MLDLSLSDFGQKLCGPSGINQLMDDLGKPFPKNCRIVQMGGGNPARIPDVEKMYRLQMEKILSIPDEFENLIGRYDAPQGKLSFIDAVASYLSKKYNWKISSENIAITNGSQSAFFYLFNMFSGKTSCNGVNKTRKIIFPLMPEYTGYADQCIENHTIVGIPSEFTIDDDNTFKYHVNFKILEDYLSSHDDNGAICVTRPTNPSGNVLTDSEIAKLSMLSKKYGIPLFIDNAYGLPWPNIIFTDNAEPYWDENVVLSMSLSKIGFPSVRTGIIIGEKSIIKNISRINAIAALASGSIGQALAQNLIKSGELISVAENSVRPFYLEKSKKTQEFIHQYFAGTDYKIHKSEGSIFIWLLLPSLKITTLMFYQVLKAKGIFVMPGEYFFFGDSVNKDVNIKDHPHYSKCLRLNYARPEDEIEYGIKSIAEEYKKVMK